MWREVLTRKGNSPKYMVRSKNKEIPSPKILQRCVVQGQGDYKAKYEKKLYLLEVSIFYRILRTYELSWQRDCTERIAYKRSYAKNLEKIFDEL